MEVNVVRVGILSSLTLFSINQVFFFCDMLLLLFGSPPPNTWLERRSGGFGGKTENAS